jgi:hypothetical protein
LIDCTFIKANILRLKSIFLFGSRASIKLFTFISARAIQYRRKQMSFQHQRQFLKKIFEVTIS